MLYIIKFDYGWSAGLRDIQVEVWTTDNGRRTLAGLRLSWVSLGSGNPAKYKTLLIRLIGARANDI